MANNNKHFDHDRIIINDVYTQYVYKICLNGTKKYNIKSIENWTYFALNNYIIVGINN